MRPVLLINLAPVSQVVALHAITLVGRYQTFFKPFQLHVALPDIGVDLLRVALAFEQAAGIGRQVLFRLTNYLDRMDAGLLANFISCRFLRQGIA
jgi:hypothetical protein